MMKKLAITLAAFTSLVSPALAQERTFITNPPTTTGGGVTYTSGTNTVAATAADGVRIHTVTRPIEQGEKYRYEFTVSGYSTGGVQPYVGSIRESWTGPDVTAPRSAAAFPTNPGQVPIADNFTTANGLQSDTASSTYEDPVGAYRMFCESGPIAPIDPMLVPGKPGGSHLHNFFGNTGVTAYSTYKSLRTVGGSSCGTDQSNPVWRSAYWFPAMMDGVGGVVTMQSVNVYYKRAPVGSLDCSGYVTGTGTCVGLPNGLQMIWGYNMQTMTPPPSSGYGSVNWACWNSSRAGVGASAGEVYYPNLKLLREAAGSCPVGNYIVINTDAPSCWDGTRLATANFRDHVALGTGGVFFHGKCPSTHPYHFPHISLQIAFNVDSNLNTWRLSSDDQMGMGVVAGETFHTDFWEAVSPAFKAQWEAACIEMVLSCSSGTNGTNAKIKASRNLSQGKSRVIPVNRQGFGVIRRKNGTFTGEFTAPANGEFGLNFYLFTGNITGFKVTKIAKGGRGPVTTTSTQ